MTENPTMMEFSEDVTNAEAPPPLPEGEYPASVRGAQIMQSAKGNHYFAVQFFVSPDDYPADYTQGDSDGTVLTYRRVPAEDTMRGRYQVRRFCESIGAPTGKRVDSNDWIGLEATIVVSHEEYEGEPRAQIRQVKPRD